jgi:hypothetical protein
MEGFGWRHEVVVHFIGGFADYRLLNDSKPVTLDQLPPELKKQLEEYRAHFRPLPGR